MKKGQIITGKLTGFTYVGKDVSFCKVTMTDADGNTHKALAGPSAVFPFPMMIGLKGADAPMCMTVDEVEHPTYGVTYNNVEFSIA